MTKRNNKGFSIVDSIIAVAVLTILITPILYQVIHTMNTSRQAKERQYVLDNAQYVMTFFQSTKDENLFKQDLSDPTIQIVEDDLSNSDSKIDVLGRAHEDDIYCKLYLLEKDPTTSDFTLTQISERDFEETGHDHDDYNIKYGIDCYLLSTVPLGKNGNSFKRTVVVDDIGSKVINIKDADGSIKYDIAYDINSEHNLYGLTADDVTHFVDDLGWELNDDGMLVKYDSIIIDSESFDVKKEVVVVPHGKYYDTSNNVIDTRYSDPNSMEMSFMQNLDANKVALIQGNAASFDKQAENDFFNIKMNYLKDESPEQYNQYLISKNGITGFNTVDTARKATRISIYKTMDYSHKECYQVDCDVFYYDHFQLVGTAPIHDEVLSYNVYSKKFYTSNKSPDIYFVYEPYVTNSSDTYLTFRYAPLDTIFVYNDEDSKESKLYLIKPEWDQLSVKYDRYDKSNSAVDSETGKPIYNEANKPRPDKDDVFWTYGSRGEEIPVEIQFAWIGESNGGANTPLRVFTNIKTEAKYKDALSRDTVLTDASMLYTDTHNGGNFRSYSSPGIIEKLDDLGADVYVTDTGSVSDYSGSSAIDTDPADDLGDAKKDYIRSIVDDVSSKNRLNTVEVTFRRVGDSDDSKPIARYSGAKEVN